MPKLLLRPVAAAVCLVAVAAPAAGQSIRQTVGETINAIHAEQRSRDSAREGQEEAERQAAALQAQRNAAMARGTAALLEQVRPHCVTDTGKADVAPFVPKGFDGSAVLICGVLQAERSRAEAAR